MEGSCEGGRERGKIDGREKIECLDVSKALREGERERGREGRR
jgi:hypothetical protein